MTDGYICKYATAGKTISCNTNPTTFQVSLGLVAGTLTDTYWCRYTAAGTLLNCDVNPALYATLASPTFTGSVGMPANQAYSTTGIMSGAVGFLTKSTTYTVGTGTAQEAYGYFFTGTGAFTFTVPTAVVGMNICFQAIGANLIKIKPTANDYITLDGVILTQNYTIKSNGTAGDSICIIATSAGNWTTWGNKGPWVSNGS